MSCGRRSFGRPPAGVAVAPWPETLAVPSLNRNAPDTKVQFFFVFEARGRGSSRHGIVLRWHDAQFVFP